MGAVDGVVAVLAAEAADAVETLGGDHDHESTTSTTPEDTSTTVTTPPDTTPPDVEEGIFLSGPLGFTVQGAPAPATPIPQQPNFTG